MSAGPIQFACRGCGGVIAGDSGWLVVDLDEVMRSEQAWQDHDNAHPTGLCTIDDLMDLPERVEWCAWHRRCDPNVGANGYWIESERISTWPQVAEWTAHLMEKDWLRHTDWDAVLRRLAASDGAPRGAAA